MTAKTIRDNYRFLAGIPAVLHLDNDYACQAYDLSRSGVLLIGKIPPASGEVRITLRSGGGDLELAMDAHVARTEQDPAGEENVLGLEFEGLDDADEPTLEALISRIIEGVAPAPFQTLPANAPPEEIRRALDQVPLAHRMALAARGIPRDRQILLHDPNLQVIDSLARNPNLVPPEVRMILRMPNLLPTTLESLARDPRWRNNEQFVVQIATHSAVTFALADKLVMSLGPEGRRRVLRTSGLKSALRAKLLKQMGQHGGSR